MHRLKARQENVPQAKSERLLIFQISVIGKLCKVGAAGCSFAAYPLHGNAMLPPVTAVPAMAVPTVQPTEAAGASATQFAEKLDVPSLHEGAEFARMVAASDPASVAAAMPRGSEGIASQLMRQIDQITHHLGMLHDGAAAPAVPGQMASPAAANTLDAVHAQTNTALAQMEHAYGFAIETTMASRGSTESTKIFNTLLKGQ